MKAKKDMASTALASLQAVSPAGYPLQIEHAPKVTATVTEVAWDAESDAVTSHNTHRMVKVIISTKIIDVMAPFRTWSTIEYAGRVMSVKAPVARAIAAKGGYEAESSKSPKSFGKVTSVKTMICMDNATTMAANRQPRPEDRIIRYEN
jgi:hypothetical protein